MRYSTPLALLAGTLATSVSLADVQLPSLFSDHMVLQRNAEVAVFGTANPGESVTVLCDWLDSEVTTLTGETGRWKVTVRTPGAGGPHELIVRGDNELAVRDILFGEVWLASGQSNMEWPVHDPESDRGVDRAEAEVAAADHPELRMFSVRNDWSLTPRREVEGSWKVCSPETVGRFSAVGYFFAERLHGELDVPIGILASEWGGTKAEAWTSEEALRAHGGFDEALDKAAASLSSGGTTVSLEALQEAWWQGFERVDPGFQGSGWMDANFDDSSWKPALVPANWSSLELGEFDGAVWFRRAFSIPDGWQGRDLVLEIGPIDDMDLAWFDGVLVGETRGSDRWNAPRSYRIPAELVTGEPHVMTVCAVDTGGAGTFGSSGGPFELRVADDSSASISLAGTWRHRPSSDMDELDEYPRSGPFNHHTPSALYNAMIAPLEDFTIAGAIWYQGESNRKRAHQYRTLFPAMIEDWRARFGRADLPFYFVQIAPFTYGGDRGETAELREAQQFALALPGTGMVVTTDVGDVDDIHPRNKRPVGERLAGLALARTYGRDLPDDSGPLMRSFAAQDNGIRVFFDHARGLTCNGEELSHFTVAGEDREFAPAIAVIDNESVLVHSPLVANPVAVRFAWSPDAEPNLFNGAGLPAAPFRTDDWPGVTSQQ